MFGSHGWADGYFPSTSVHSNLTRFFFGLNIEVGMGEVCKISRGVCGKLNGPSPAGLQARAPTGRCALHATLFAGLPSRAAPMIPPLSPLLSTHRTQRPGSPARLRWRGAL